MRTVSFINSRLGPIAGVDADHTLQQFPQRLSQILARAAGVIARGVRSQGRGRKPACHPAGSNPEALLSGHGMEGEVEAALGGLPAEFREAILLVDVEELSYQEVSGVLDVPIGTVKSRVSRGRAILRDALANFAKERGIIRS